MGIMAPVTLGLPDAHKHPAVVLAHPEFGEAEIDEKLAELIRLIWAAEIVTTGCCQDHDGTGTAYISFATWTEGLERFLSISAERFDQGDVESLYNRIIFHGRQLPEDYERWSRERCWRIEGLARDARIDDFTDEGEPLDIDGRPIGEGLPKIEAHPRVLFPQSDVPEVERRFRRFLGEV
jgi:hypothetical protein